MYLLTFTFPTATFRFHIPARLARKRLPLPATVPVAAHTREKQGWLFGRPLSNTEATAFAVCAMQERLEEAIARLQRKRETALP